MIDPHAFRKLVLVLTAGLAASLAAPSAQAQYGGPFTLSPVWPSMGPGIVRQGERGAANTRNAADRATQLARDARLRGSQVGNANAASQAALGVEFGERLQVKNVIEASAAAAAGVKPGDQIVAIDSYRPDSPAALSNYLRTRARPQQQVQLLVSRDGKQQRLPATLGTAEIFVHPVEPK